VGKSTSEAGKAIRFLPILRATINFFFSSAIFVLIFAALPALMIRELAFY
jgi:hypothetical protein